MYAREISTRDNMHVEIFKRDKYTEIIPDEDMDIFMKAT